MKEVGFEGTLEEFLQHLKDDPQFYLDKKVEIWRIKFRTFILKQKLWSRNFNDFLG
jgi:hypothetical protein